MSSESVLSHPSAPDRLFTRASVVMLSVALLMMLGAHLVLDYAVRMQGAAAHRALAAAGDVAGAAAILDAVDRLASTPEGTERHGAEGRLANALAQLVAGVRRSYGSDESSLLAEADQALAIARAPDLDAREVGRLRALIDDGLQPKLDQLAQRAARQADQARSGSRWMLFASVVAQLLGIMALVGSVVRPVERRIRDWVVHTEETERENRFRLLHDPLTRMPNAIYLHAYLTRMVAAAARTSTQTAVLRVDLDKFNMLRETLGQRTSEEIIRISARRIQHALRAGDFAAYLGHDDFVVVAGDLEDANAAAHIASRVQAALSQPFSIRGGARRTGCSMGVTLISDDQADTDRILANADIALSEAQGAGAGNIRYFRESLRLEVERRETLFTELLNGLGKGQMIPYFQPQIDLATGAFSGFEALVRWMHPRHGLLTPAAFLEFADQTDLTERIGEVVLAASLAAIKEWDAAGLNMPKLGINFALAQLRDPRLIEKIKWEVERFDIDPSRLAIEVLETVLIKSDADMVVRNLRGLASAGFHIELDDFGTGHASISNLRRFMVNRIKIDRSFIFGIETSEEQQKLTASMIAMARALGISTLAEGVETEDAENMLRRLGCDQFQGFLVAKPMSQAETMRWLGAFHPRPYAAPDVAEAAAPYPNMP